MAVLIFLLVSIAARFWNFQESLYFIYDQGRDALVLQKLLHGDLVLIGPTTGLSGLFLGPLWYYLGLPGALLSGGNPYGICLWYMAISSLALPFFWWLSHRLFRERFWAIAGALWLALIPGSIGATLMIWNPLLSVPLMMGVLFAWYQVLAGKKFPRAWLAGSFFLLALTLQSEFAYAVFLLPTAVLLLPWFRRWKDMPFTSVAQDLLAIGLAIGVTLLPQIIFELRHNYLMTTSLWQGMQDTTQAISWAQLFAQRPTQLLQASTEITLGGGVHTALLLPILLLCFWIGVVVFWRGIGDADEVTRRFKKLFVIFALVPYLGYLFWRGNHGYFFPYYITPHFIFLMPLMLGGVWWLATQLRRLRYPELSWGLALSIILLVLFESMQAWWLIVGHSTSQAGLAKMLSATNQLAAWVQEDQSLAADQAPATSPVFRTYTNNVYTENYDYLYGWLARQRRWPTPITVNTDTERVVYLLIEGRQGVTRVFFDPWYAAATAGRHQIHATQIGILTLEAWAKD